MDVTNEAQKHAPPKSWRSYSGPATLVGLAALFVFTPLKWPCPMAVLFHVPCPTCGMTRATRCVIHGDFAGATAFHPLWFVLLPLVALMLVAEVRGFARTGAWGAAMQHPWTKRIGPVVLTIVIAVWLARFFGALGGPVPVG